MQNITVVRIFTEDAEQLRRMYPQYRSDAERVAEVLRQRVTITTLPRPIDGQSVPVVTTESESKS